MPILLLRISLIDRTARAGNKRHPVLGNLAAHISKPLLLFVPTGNQKEGLGLSESSSKLVVVHGNSDPELK